MNNLHLNNYPVINLYKRTSLKSEVVTQMIYGESFKIITKSLKWLKIKIINDKYIGYVKKKRFSSYVKPTHKVSVLFAKIYKKPNLKSEIAKLPYTSKIKIEKINSRFSKFQNNWIETKNIKPMKYKNKNLLTINS